MWTHVFYRYNVLVEKYIDWITYSCVKHSTEKKQKTYELKMMTLQHGTYEIVTGATGTSVKLEIKFELTRLSKCYWIV